MATGKSNVIPLDKLQPRSEAALDELLRASIEHVRAQGECFRTWARLLEAVENYTGKHWIDWH